MASCSDDYTIKIWNLNTMQKVQTLKKHTSFVVSLILLSNGNLISGSSDNTMIIWKRNTFNQYEYDSRCTSSKQWTNRSIIEISPEAIIASSDSNLSIYSLAAINAKNQWKLEYSLIGHKDAVKDLKFTGYNKQLCLSASRDHTCKLWSLTHRVCLKTFRCHEDRVDSMITMNPFIFISASRDIRVWRVFSGECQIISRDEKSLARKICTHTNNTILLVDEGGSIEIWGF
jgi:F-box/WD-40 domain protein 7